MHTHSMTLDLGYQEFYIYLAIREKRWLAIQIRKWSGDTLHTSSFYALYLELKYYGTLIAAERALQSWLYPLHNRTTILRVWIAVSTMSGVQL